MRTHVLAFHALYRCRHAGVCCTSGWTIPVEAPLYRSLHAALEWGQLRPDYSHDVAALFEPAPDLPEDTPAVLRRKPDGSCVFFEPERGNLCAIQRQVDHAHLPSACRHFPRVVVIDPRGAFVTLSHVCPTAARLLLEDAEADVVSTGPVIDHHLDLEGLDARDALPPLIRPDLLWDWEGWDLWERRAVSLLATRGRAPEESLGRLGEAVARLVRWKPADSPLEEAVSQAFAAPDRSDPISMSDEALASLCGAVDASVPAPLKPSGVSRPLTFDVPGWSDWRDVVGRYLAARGFANWVGYYGAGLETWYRSILAAYAVLRASAAQRTQEMGAALDRESLVKALGDADLMILHHASAGDLAAALDDWEER